MSFCRIGHYTTYMKEEDAINLEIAVWMSIVIVAFRTSFHAEGAHRTINPYFNVFNTIIRRRLHVILTRYLEQECVCKNHVQYDISPNILTSEIILPSYQHFLHYILEKGFSRFSIVGESEILSNYGKTITMIVLARVNGYYSPYFPQSIMEEEAKCLYGTNFSFAERDFFINKLLKETPNMSQKNQDASGASSENFTSADLTTGYNAIFNPLVSNSSCKLSLNSRDEEHNRCKKNVTRKNKTKKRTKRPAKTDTETDLEESPEDMLEESKQ